MVFIISTFCQEWCKARWRIITFLILVHALRWEILILLPLLGLPPNTNPKTPFIHDAAVIQPVVQPVWQLIVSRKRGVTLLTVNWPHWPGRTGFWPGHRASSQLTLAIKSVAAVSLIADTPVADWLLGGTRFGWHNRTRGFLVTSARYLTTVLLICKYMSMSFTRALMF